MTTNDLTQLGFTQVTSAPEREICGGFCGDLLSWVMGNAVKAQVWFTVMGNTNAIAVASLTGVAAIVLCNDAVLQNDAKEKAKEQSIAVFTTSMPEYEAAVSFSRLFG